MEDRIESEIWRIFKKYDIISDPDSSAKASIVKQKCLSEIESNPMIEHTLFVTDAYDYFVMRNILKCINT